MGLKNGTTRSPKQKGQCEGSEFSSKSKSLGQIAGTSGEYGSYQVGASRDDSYRRDTLTQREQRSGQFDGKVIDQLADEVEKGISYHKSQVHDLEKEISHHNNQVSQLENRLNELRQLAGELKKISNSD